MHVGCDDPTNDSTGGSLALFKRKRGKALPSTIGEHAVILHYALSDENHGTVEEREAIFALEHRLSGLVESDQLGEHDGNEFGGGEATIYCYGPDAGRLFEAIESEARAFPSRPAFAMLRFGEASDPHAPTQRIDL